MLKKISVIIVFSILVAVFYVSGLVDLLTLDGLKDSLTNFEQLREQSPATVIFTFFVSYILVTALSLPGAAILTLAAGALFGLWQGLLIVSFASSIGALCAFITSRYLFREALQKRYQQRIATIDKGIKKEGGFYLFTLRLVPIFPFFLVNILMGLTAIRAFTFYWVSQLGMLAGTLVYVNAGTQLAQIDSLSGILSPNIILSFAVLGLFPIFANKLLAAIKKRRVYKGWNKPKSFDRNIVVIGAGAGGLVSSYIGAAVKAKVTLVEAGEMGGDCLNYGCVPSKAIIKSAKIVNQFNKADQYGIEPQTASFSFKTVMQRVHRVIAEIAPHDSVERYTDLGVEVIKGYAKIIDPWTVQITLEDGSVQSLTTRSIIIATGASPFVPPLGGIEQSGYVTSDTVWTEFAKLDTAPKKLVILGGGPIGCELAQSFSRLGSEVFQIEMADRVLQQEDIEVSEFATQSLRDSGVNVLTNHTALRCEQHAGKKYIVVKHNDQEHSIEYDQLLCAVGRAARLKGYGLEALGIETGKTIEVNDYLETKYPNILAAGDIVGPYQFTHVAAHQAWYAAVNALFGSMKKFKVDYSIIPRVTFIDPEVARVGLNEQEAKAENIAYEITEFHFHELDRAITESSTKGFIKVLTKPGKDTLLGVTIISDHAGELLAEFVLAMKHGLGLNKILGTIHSYPTWAESNKYIAGEWKRNHSPEKLLSIIEKFHHWMRG